MIPFAALAGVTATGPGGTYDLGSTEADFTFWVDNSDPSSSATVRIEGSPDGALWKALAADTNVSGGSLLASTVGPAAGGNFIWCRYVRANLLSVNSGSPVITAWITGPGRDE